MFVHRGHTSKGVIITVPAGKVSALYAGDCRFKSPPGMPFFFAGNIYFFLCSYSDNALMMMNPLFGSATWVVRDSLKKQNKTKKGSQPLSMLD